MGTNIVSPFMDDFGTLVYPYMLKASYMARYYFFRG